MGKWDDPEYRRAYFKRRRERDREKLKRYFRAYRRKNLMRLRQKDRAYSAAHREEARARAKAWYYENISRAKEARRNWAARNKEKTRGYYEASKPRRPAYEKKRYSKRKACPKHQAYKRLYHEKNAEKIRAKVQAWAKANRERALLNAQNSRGRRRARIRGAVVSKVKLRQIIERDRGHCGICGDPVAPRDLSFDHIVPIAKGGPHIPDNLQVAHISCNKGKGARLITTAGL